MGKGTRVAVGFAAAIAVASVFNNSPYIAVLTIWLAINILITASFRFVLLIGELNFAIAGFAGIGAYTAGSATTIFDVPFPLAVVLGAAVAGLVSLPFGYITLRAKGPYFMLISFAFTEVMRLIYSRTDAIGGNSGMIGLFPPDWLAPWYTAVVVLLCTAGLLVLYRMERSDFGKIMVAVRNNDALVETLAIDVHRFKVRVLAVSSVIAGMCGALLAHANNVISPGDFGFLLAVFTLAYLKLGGEGHIGGAILGATLLTLLAQYAMGFGAYEHIFYGGAIVLAVLLLPDGLVGLWMKWRGRGPAAHARAGH